MRPSEGCRVPAVDPCARLGRRIRQLRARLRISQEELADRCGLHRTYSGGIERGERNVSLLNIVAIAHSLQVKPFRLLQDIQ